MATKLTTEIFIERARQVHGDRYDYSKVEYVNTKTKVCIVCKEHGEFWQKAETHLLGNLCPKCSINARTLPRKWNKEACHIEAKKYKSRSEYSKNAGAAYRVSLLNGWLDDYSWFSSPKKYNYWSKDTCYIEARKYTTKGEFAKNSSTAYAVSRQNDWLKDYDWFVDGCTPAGYWTYDRCETEARQYTTKKAFREGNSKAYAAALRHKWLSKFTWFVPRFVWTYELCFKEAEKYPTKRAFEKGSCGAYIAARRNGWLKDYVWMVKNRVNVLKDKVDSVYAYYFEEFNAVYIGRTIDPQRRDHEHIINIDIDAVAKFAHEHHIPVPQMVILETDLTLEEGQDREDYWLNHYKSNGYSILNKAQTGKGKGSIGTIGAGKWNKTTTLNESKKYKTRQEFRIGSVGAYTRALKQGWIKEYSWLTPSRNKGYNVWNYESCYEEALLYESRRDFEIGSSGAYLSAKRHGWLEEYNWFLSKEEQLSLLWTYENCLNESKKYKTYGEFKKKNRDAFLIAESNGWINNFTWLSKVYVHSTFWTYEKCYEEAKKYRSRTEFEYAKGAGQAYRVARSNGWLEDYTWFEQKQKPSGFWTYEKCYNEAKKYKSRKEFEYGKGSSMAYKTARKNGWLDDYTWFEQKRKPNGFWTKEQCSKEASLYKTKTEFKNGSKSAYAISRRNNWLNDFFSKDSGNDEK